PLYSATAMPLAGYATGLLVESNMGRPTKVEGNPRHPASPPPAGQNPDGPYTWGPTDVFAQASVLTLYDPDRSQSVRHLADVSNWELFVADVRWALQIERKEAKTSNVRLRILTETVTSPTLLNQIRAVLRRFPNARWHQYEPSGRQNILAGARAAFGFHVVPQYRFDRANVILSLDADFLSCSPGHLRYVRDFSDKRRVGKDPATGKDRSFMSRLYVVESTATTTGAKADYRWPLRAADVGEFGRAVANKVGIRAVGAGKHSVPWLNTLVDDLLKKQNKGRSIIIAGEHQGMEVHALAHALNEKLGNVGQTMSYTEPGEVPLVEEPLF